MILFIEKKRKAALHPIKLIKKYHLYYSLFNPRITMSFTSFHPFYIRFDTCHSKMTYETNTFKYEIIAYNYRTDLDLKMSHVCR